MSSISKAIGALLGGLIGVIFSLAAVHGIGDGTQILGISQDVVLSILSPLGAVIATYLAPANKPA